jgi:hypothetical protein
MEFMLTKADPQHLNLTATQEVSHRAGNLMTRKIWLPRILYDLLPYFYLTAGFAAFFATLYISEWFWILPHYLLFSAACLHLAYTVYVRRNGSPDNVPGDTQ